MTEPSPGTDEGVARLESVLAGTRVNSERALRDLHRAMRKDLRRAERRADRAEQRLEEVRRKLRQARRRARRSEELFAARVPPASLVTRVRTRLRRALPGPSR